ncbi:hypothetical protein [Gaopeijia maritima]|uniref:Uncharacterized protein n=1 Tax=Gaopeijia maritima TaxID=3119007 RepID=A0ABU9E6C6_9BACT
MILRALVLATLAFAGSCGGEGGTDPEPTPTPTIAITISPQSASLEQGQSAEVTVALTRGGGFTGAVALSVTGLVSGVQSTTGSIAAGATQATLTVTALESASAGTLALQVQASGSGVTSVQRALALTITERPVGTFALTLDPDELTLEQGTPGSVEVGIDRSGGFAGPVTLSLDGAPADLGASFMEESVSGTTTTLQLAPTTGLPAGDYTVTVRGAGEGTADAEAVLDLTITAAPVQVSWELCEGQIMGDWFAVRDGDGEWRRITPTGRTFAFEFRGETGAIAYAQAPEPGDVNLVVSLLAREDLQIANPVLTPFPCTEQNRTLNVAASPALPTSAHFAAAAIDNTFVARFGSGSVVLPFDHLPEGPLDLAGATGTRLFPSGAIDVDRYFLSRGINPANGATATMDFNGPHAFAPVDIEVTLDAPPGEMAFLAASLATARTAAPLVETTPGAATAWTLPIPPASQLLGDEVLVASVSTEGDFDAPGDQYRLVDRVFVGEDDQTLSLGPTLQGVTFSAGERQPSFRGRIQYAPQAPYGSLYLAIFGQEVAGATTTHMLTASSRYLDGSALDETFPDLAGVEGFDSDWALRPGMSVLTQFIAIGWTGDPGLNPIRARRPGDQFTAFLRGEITP